MNRSRRILLYLNRMFPPALMVPLGIANFLAVYLIMQLLTGRQTLSVGWDAFLGATTVVLFSLLMRVYDELKDADADLRFAQQGDSHFANRPLVTGEVKIQDIRLLRWIVTGLLVAVNVLMWDPVVFAAFAATFLMTWLSYKWFYCAAISRNLLLAFATHNPLALMLSGYAVAVYVARFGTSGIDASCGLLLIGLWLPIAAWETSRKIRLPEDETDYATYSRIFGTRTAAVIPAVFTMVSTVCLVSVARMAGLPWLASAMLIAMMSIVVARSAILVIAPTQGRSNLRPYAEAFLAVAYAGPVIMILVTQPIRFVA